MTLSRKQREIATRHALFLDIAKRMLDEDGFHRLSMERIAEVAEYSKGTIYQHFTCKEEILIQLCVESLTNLLAMFERAIALEGTHRDRIIAIFYANHCCGSLEGNHQDMLQQFSMHGVRDKVTEESAERHGQLEQRIFAMVKNVVDQAIQDGDLPKHKQLQSAEVVFGLWSLSYGGQHLQTSDLPLSEFGIANPDLTLLRTMSLILDGLKWQPLHDETHFKTLLAQLQIDIFAEDAEQQKDNAVQN